MIALDASVAIKWFKPDEKSSSAIFYLEEHEAGRNPIFAPTLIRYEIINALRYSKKLTKIDLEKIISLLSRVNLSYVAPDDYLLTSSLEISLTADVSLYDASYVALAQRLDCPLITADKKLFNKAKDFTEVILI